jgi:hypothetical protein
MLYIVIYSHPKSFENHKSEIQKKYQDGPQQPIHNLFNHFNLAFEQVVFEQLLHD